MRFGEIDAVGSERGSGNRSFLDAFHFFVIGYALLAAVSYARPASRVRVTKKFL